MLSIQGILDLINDNSYKKPLLIERWREVYYRMSLHIDGVCPAYRDIRTGVWQDNAPYIHTNQYTWDAYYQWIFETIIYNRYPREPQILRNFRLSLHKPFTKDPFYQIIQVVTGAIFQDSGYQVTVNDQEDNDYIWGANFHKKNLVRYLADRFQMICADPNGLFVVAPKEPHYATTTSRIEPEIWFISSKDIRWVTKDEVIFCIDDVMWAVNGMAYHRFEKTEGDKYVNVDNDFGGYYYAHFLNRVPAYVAGGQWNNRGYYDSWLTAALPIADEYLMTKSDEVMVMKNAGFPFIIEADTDCPDCESRSGWVQDACDCDRSDSTCRCSGTGWIRNKCNTCHGEGSISRSPIDRIIAPADEMDKDLIKVVNIDTSINKLHLDNNKVIFQSLKSALHLHYIDEAQSGTAKDKDMETRYQFIMSIANDYFDRLIPSSLNDILALRNVTVNGGIVMPKPTDYILVKPTQFQIKTSFDLLEELDKGKKSGIPAYQQAALLEDYVDKQFGGNDVLKKKTQVINTIDPLANMLPADVQSVVMNNAATNRDWQFSVKLNYILDKLIRQRGEEWFLRASIDDIEILARTEFDKIVPKPIDMNEPLVIDENKAFIS